MKVEEARSIALDRFAGDEYDHFGKPAYRIAPKKAGGKPGRTYMTLWLNEGHAVLMLDVELQARLLESGGPGFRPHPSKWGAKGATIADLQGLSMKVFTEALSMAVEHARR